MLILTGVLRLACIILFRSNGKFKTKTVVFGIRLSVSAFSVPCFIGSKLQ